MVVLLLKNDNTSSKNTTLPQTLRPVKEIRRVCLDGHESQHVSEVFIMDHRGVVDNVNAVNRH